MKVNPKIASLAKLTAAQESRFVLPAVLYDGKTAVVTDGHQMTIVTDKSEVEASTPMLLSIEALGMLKKLPPKQKRYEMPHVIEVQPGEHLDTITVSDAGGEMKAQSTTAHVNGNFPEVERVRGRSENLPIRYSFDAKLLVKVLEGIIELDKDNRVATVVTLEFGKKGGPILIKSQTPEFDIESSVMPCRATSGPTTPEEKLEGEITLRILKAAKQIRAEMEPKPEPQPEPEPTAVAEPAAELVEA